MDFPRLRMKWHFQNFFTSEWIERTNSIRLNSWQAQLDKEEEWVRKMWKGHLIIWNTNRDGQWMARANSLSDESLGMTNCIDLLNILHMIIDTESYWSNHQYTSLWSSSTPLIWSRWNVSFARAQYTISCLVDRIRQVHILSWQ